MMFSIFHAATNLSKLINQHCKSTGQYTVPVWLDIYRSSVHCIDVTVTEHRLLYTDNKTDSTKCQELPVLKDNFVILTKILSRNDKSKPNYGTDLLYVLRILLVPKVFVAIFSVLANVRGYVHI